MVRKYIIELSTCVPSKPLRIQEFDRVHACVLPGPRQAQSNRRRPDGECPKRRRLKNRPKLPRPRPCRDRYFVCTPTGCASPRRTKRPRLSRPRPCRDSFFVRTPAGCALRHGCAWRARGNAASSTRSAWASPPRRVRGPFTARTCGACAGEHCKFDWIELGVIGALRM